MDIKEIVLVGEKINRHSIVSLAGIIEKEPAVRQVPINRISLSECLNRSYPAGSLLLFSFFSGQFPGVFSMIRQIRTQNPECVLAAGGPHPSGAPVQTLQAGFDYVFRGEGEISIPSWLKALHDDLPMNTVPGIHYWEEGRPVCTPKPEWSDPDHCYCISKTFRSSFPPEITRGCPFACKFCQVSALFGRHMRHRSPESVWSVIHKGQRFVRFVSPNAFSYGSHLKGSINYGAITELLEGIRRIDSHIQIFFGSFPSEVRPEDVTDESIRIIKQYTNNVALALGAQSGSDRLLNYMNRQHTSQDVFLAIERIHRAGMQSKVDFIFGLPGENEEDLEITFRFIQQIIPMNSEIRIHTFIPLPGTGFAHESPGFISPGTRRRLHSLIGKGVASGPWLHKERINQSISHFIGSHSGEIYH